MKKYYFTFCGDDEKYANCVQPIIARDYTSARRLMIEKYGTYWAFQYTVEEWNRWCEERPFYFPVEKELPVIVEEV